MSEDSPNIPNYLQPDWTIGPGFPPEKYDPDLEREIEAYVSWQTIRQQFGNVIVEFQLLESVLKDAISHLLNPHDYTFGRIVTASMQFGQILGVLYALFHYKNFGNDNLESLKKVLRKCLDCTQKRNEMVHSYWTPNEDGLGLRLRIKRSNIGRPYETEKITITPETLEADVAFYEATRKELNDLFVRLFPEFRS
jgi:hypothetical protein